MMQHHTGAFAMPIGRQGRSAGAFWIALCRQYCHRLLLQSIEERGCDSDPHQDDHPDASSQKVVVVEEITPRTLRHVMTKEKLEGDCHAEPRQTNGQGLPC